jgi:HK97 family phage portal protein
VGKQPPEKRTRKRGVEQRALIPRDTPNGNDPASHPPATVGPDGYTPGDPDGVELVVESPASYHDGVPPRPQPWSGWPATWETPWWWSSRLEELCDMAWMCLDLNTWVLSSMPAYLVGAADSLDTAWLDNPDPDYYSSWEEFARSLFWDLWTGEAFVLVTARYATGWPARFHVVEPWMVEVEIADDGLRSYRIGNIGVPRDDIVHLRYRATASQAHGVGPLEVGRARLVAAAMLARYAGNLVGTGAVPPAVLKHPGRLTAEQAERLKADWVSARMSAMGVPAVLSDGLEFETLGYSPADLALVELSQLNDSRIAVLMGTVPFQMGLPSGGDSMTYSNVSSLFDYHWRASLRPKAQTAMRGLSQRLLPRGTTVELNRDAYVQPGPLERAQTWEILARVGAVTVEEIREFERYDATPTTSPQLTSGVLQ